MEVTVLAYNFSTEARQVQNMPRNWRCRDSHFSAKTRLYSRTVTPGPVPDLPLRSTDASTRFIDLMSPQKSILWQLAKCTTSWTVPYCLPLPQHSPMSLSTTLPHGVYPTELSCLGLTWRMP
jgi:hypothetical protein